MADAQNANHAPEAKSNPLHLNTWVRIGLAIGGMAMLAVMSFALFYKGLDGASQVSLVAAGAAFLALAAIGVVPARAKFKDYEHDFGELNATAARTELLAEGKPETAADIAAGSQGKSVIPADDITIPLFLDEGRRSRLFALSPKSALLSVFGELEEQLRGLADDAGIAAGAGSPARHVPLRRLARELQSERWLSSWHVEMLEQLSQLRNQAAHAPSDVSPAVSRLGSQVEIAAELANDLAQFRVAARNGFRPQ
jgi:hypothetical protein